MEQEGGADWSNIAMVSGWGCPACEGIRESGRRGRRALAMLGDRVGRRFRCNARASSQPPCPKKKKSLQATNLCNCLPRSPHTQNTRLPPALQRARPLTMASSRIFVRNLPPTLSDGDFRKHFAQQDVVTDAKLLANRRIGYVGYKTPEAAEKAVKYFNKTFIRMSRIGVELARPVRTVSRLCARFC